ncbi:MAG: response regulator [Chloroflexi bacterium]|nr:MAG: response regulator [Chloroflexota bacterium]
MAGEKSLSTLWGRVLIVEDEDYWQQVLRETLEDTCEVELASSYEEARRALARAQEEGRPFHLVTVDIGLPDLEGHPAEPGDSSYPQVKAGQRIVHYVNLHYPQLLCIVVTGRPDISTMQVRDFFKRYNVFDFITKDRFDLQEFREIVHKALMEARQQGQQAGGHRIGRYEILEELGRGAMGIVYKARDPNIDRIVALKVLHPTLSAYPELQQRFRREARSAGRLVHPNIVIVFDAAEDRGTSFLVMEYLDGPTLAAVIEREGPLSVPRSVQIAIQTCDALDYAHQQGVIHRDIKPSNIILLPGDQVKITDFGIAKLVEGPQLTRTGIVGTFNYMSPEQAMEKPVDHRADIYSLGIVLFEMLTGRVPFQADTPVAVALKHISEPLPLPRTLNPAIPPALEAILLKATAKDQEERYQTAGEMAAALRAL